MSYIDGLPPSTALAPTDLIAVDQGGTGVPGSAITKSATIAQVFGGAGIFLPLVGGTLTGGLSGTTASFTGSVTAPQVSAPSGNLKFVGVGSSGFSFQGSAGGNAFVVNGNAASIANQITIQPATAGSTPAILMGGSDASVGLNITAKGGGTISLINNSAVWAGATKTATSLFAVGLTGTSTGTTANIFSIVASDNIDRSIATSNPITALNIEHDYGGGTTKGGRMAFNALLLQTAANTDSGADNFYTAGRFTSFARFTQPGSSATNPLGRIFGLNALSTIQNGFVATNLYQVAGVEFNVGISAGSSAALRDGIVIADLNGTAQGFWADNAYWVYGAGTGWRYGFQFGDTQAWPMDTTIGTMFGAHHGGGNSPGNATNNLATMWGADFSEVTFPSTGNPYDGGPFRSNNWSVDGVGQMAIGSTYFTPSASGLSINARGAIGTSATIAVAGSGYIPGSTQVFSAYGGLWAVAIGVGGVPTSVLAMFAPPQIPSTTPPANPVTPVNLNRQDAGTGLTFNISWNTTATTLALQAAGGATTIGGTLGVTGILTAPTAAVDTNTTQAATTAYYVGQAGTATPLINGTAAAGTSKRWTPIDHIHPTDTTRAPLASPTFTGTVTIPGGASISGFAPLASPTFTGTINVNGTMLVGNSTTQQQMRMNGPAGVGRTIVWQTAGSTRWQMAGNSAAEGGGNAGTDLAITAFADDGTTTLSIPVTFVRSLGLMRLGTGGVTANGVVATTMTSLGPTGSHTTVQEWMTIQNSSGATRYIPLY